MLFPHPLALLTIGAISAFVAGKRGKNPYLWFFLGMLFGIFGLIYLFFSRPIRKTGARKAKTQQKDPNTIDVTPTFDPSFKEKLWYYLDPSNKQKGPMSFDRLLHTFREGAVSSKTYVWNESLKNWQPLGDFINSTRSG